MFDPTAFDNMKVVIEGAVYDRDLDGEIAILDRNDMINMAKMSRTYEITFSLSDRKKAHLPEAVCTFILEACLENLAAEILPNSSKNNLSGSHITIKFSTEHRKKQELINSIGEELKTIWGKERSYKQVISYDPYKGKDLVMNEVYVKFNRLIYEDQMDDITHMMDYMVLSLKRLNEIIRS